MDPISSMSVGQLPKRAPRTSRLLPAVVGLMLSCTASTARAQSPILLRDVTAQTGIAFRHNDGGNGQRYIMEFVGAGLALFDYDGDGWTDIYFLNGAPLRGTEIQEPLRNALFRNEGQGRFVDVTQQAGVGDTGYGLGVSAADYDNDGDQDLYLNNYGSNVLYRNNGDGSFSNVTGSAGVQNGDRCGAGTCFLDMDGDGDLDLYVSNYVRFSYERHDEITQRGVVISGPIDFKPDPDTLYRNNGDGTFTDVSLESGVGRHKGTGMGIVCGDYDNDGDTDLFICNDTLANYFFENDGAGHFEEVGLFSGAAYNYGGMQQGSMGVDCGDYDNDGRLDFFMTNYQGEMPVMYRNLGDSLLEDVTIQIGVGRSAARYVTWGNGLVDFDNDGDRDLFIACGNLTDLVENLDDTWEYEARNILLMNTGAGKFVDVSDSSGDGLKVKLVSRGTAFEDLDHDGDLDVVILNARSQPTVLRNDSSRGAHWIEFQLQGRVTNRDGIGARVKVVAGDLVQIDEVHSGRGYQSHYGTRLHFGLGRHDHIDRVEVQWIGGGVEVFENLNVDQPIYLQEGAGDSVD